MATYEVRTSYSYLSFLMKNFSFMTIDLRKFLKGLIFSVTKPKEVISRNINLNFDVGVRSSLLISLHRVSLCFLDFTEFVSYGQVSSITLSSSLISIATSGLARRNSGFCCGPVDVLFS